MSRKKKMIIVFLVLIVGIICSVYFYTFHGKHRDIAQEEATEKFYAPALLSNFIKQDNVPNKLVDHVIEVRGVLTSNENSTVVLNGMVQVDFAKIPNTPLKTGEDIVVKGRCVGYDELLEVVKIDQATRIIN